MYVEKDDDGPGRTELRTMRRPDSNPTETKKLFKFSNHFPTYPIYQLYFFLFYFFFHPLDPRSPLHCPGDKHSRRIPRLGVGLQLLNLSISQPRSLSFSPSLILPFLSSQYLSFSLSLPAGGRYATWSRQRARGDPSMRLEREKEGEEWRKKEGNTGRGRGKNCTNEGIRQRA